MSGRASWPCTAPRSPPTCLRILRTWSWLLMQTQRSKKVGCLLPAASSTLCAKIMLFNVQAVGMLRGMIERRSYRSIHGM